MKTYFAIIKAAQNTFIGISLVILTLLPSLMVFYPDWFAGDITSLLFAFAHTSLFFVMMIRSLADLFPTIKWLRPLVILRKGVGIFSASFIVSFILAKLITDPVGYFISLATPAYWSFETYAFFAHCADIAAVLLLITSNNLSKQILGKNWKRIQRLSYVYFYGSSIYVIFTLNNHSVLTYAALVSIVTALAFARNTLAVPASLQAKTP